MDYFYRVVGGAWDDTLAVFGGPGVVFVSLLILIIFLAIVLKWLGPKEMRNELRIALAAGAATVLVASGLFVGHVLVFTPMRLYTEELDKRAALENVERMLSNQEDTQDATITALNESMDSLERDNQDLRDKLADAREARPIELQASPQMQPQAEGFRVSGLRQVASPRDEYPFALELTLTVEANVQPFGALVECSQSVVGDFRVIGVGTMQMVYVGPLNNDPRFFRFSFRSPAVTPQTPVVVTLMSTQAFEVLSVERIPSVL